MRAFGRQIRGEARDAHVWQADYARRSSFWRKTGTPCTQLPLQNYVASSNREGCVPGERHREMSAVQLVGCSTRGHVS